MMAFFQNTHSLHSMHAFQYCCCCSCYYVLLYIVAVRLTPTNQVLLVVGVILLSVATIVGIVLIVVDVRTHKGNLVYITHFTISSIFQDQGYF